MQRNIAEVANETREVALFRFFFFLGGGGGGGQLPVTCERYNICTVTGKGTSLFFIIIIIIINFFSVNRYKYSNIQQMHNMS